MDRAQKEELVATMHETFSSSEIVIVCLNKGLSVASSTELRKKIREAGASIRIVKNRLAKRALDGVNLADINDLLVGPTMFAYAKDPVAVAKAVHDFASVDTNKIEVLGGAMGMTRLDANGVKTLASLPSLDELRGKILGVLTTPASRIAQISGAPAAQVARVIQAYADKNAA